MVTYQQQNNYRVGKVNDEEFSENTRNDKELKWFCLQV